MNTGGVGGRVDLSCCIQALWVGKVWAKSVGCVISPCMSMLHTCGTESKLQGDFPSNACRAAAEDFGKAWRTGVGGLWLGRVTSSQAVAMFVSARFTRGVG